MRPDAGHAEPPGPERVGQALRAARERLGWELPEVAKTLRIGLDYLEALEAGRIGQLPAPAYALGYLRAYAAALGLDPREQVRRFKSLSGDLQQRIELNFPVPMPERGVPTGAVLLLTLVLAVIVYAGWYRLSGEGRLPAEVVRPIPERLAPLAMQAIPPTPRFSPEPVAPPAETAAIDQPAPPAPMPSVPPSSAAAAALPVAPAPQTIPAAPDEPRIVLRARADTWLQVRDRSGPVLLNRTLKTGETWPVPPQKPNLVLTTGNAGGTELLVDGVLAPALGNSGAVRRDVPLDPDLLRDGKLTLPRSGASQ